MAGGVGSNPLSSYAPDYDFKTLENKPEEVSLVTENLVQFFKGLQTQTESPAPLTQERVSLSEDENRLLKFTQELLHHTPLNQPQREHLWDAINHSTLNHANEGEKVLSDLISKSTDILNEPQESDVSTKTLRSREMQLFQLERRRDLLLKKHSDEMSQIKEVEISPLLTVVAVTATVVATAGLALLAAFAPLVFFILFMIPFLVLPLLDHLGITPKFLSEEPPPPSLADFNRVSEEIKELEKLMRLDKKILKAEQNPKL